MEELSVEKQALPVWSSKQLYIVTFFAGPAAAGYLISKNYQALNNPLYAKRALWIGIIGCAIFILIMGFLEIFSPGFFEKGKLSFLPSLLFSLSLSNTSVVKQKKEIKELRKAGWPRYSYFKLIPVIVLSTLAMLAFSLIFQLLVTACCQP